MIFENEATAMDNLISSLLTAVEKRVNPLSFETWFRPITRGGKEEATIVLQVPNETFRNWIASNYGEILEDSLEELNLQRPLQQLDLQTDRRL